MKISLKKLNAILLSVILILAMTLPITVNAQDNEDWQENPVFSCAFRDEDNNAVDGNTLTAGTYFVDILLSGVKTVSGLEVSATYDESVVSNVEVVSTYADVEEANMVCGTAKAENGEVIVCMVSDNDDYTVLDQKTVTIATLLVTVNSPCDFADYFTFSENEKLTLIMINHSYDDVDCYVSVNVTEEADYLHKAITFDVTPELKADAFDVEGQITIANDPTGASTDFGIVGINVSVDVNGETVTAVTDENGYYTLPAIPAGEYLMDISGETTIDRQVTLVVSEDKATDGVINVSSVGIVICDYNGDSKVNSTDTSTFLRYKSGDYYVYADFNGDGKVNSTDTSIYCRFVRVTIEYPTTLL